MNGLFPLLHVYKTILTDQFMRITFSFIGRVESAGSRRTEMHDEFVTNPFPWNINHSLKIQYNHFSILAWCYSMHHIWFRCLVFCVGSTLSYLLILFNCDFLFFCYFREYMYIENKNHTGNDGIFLQRFNTKHEYAYNLCNCIHERFVCDRVSLNCDT